MTPAAPGVPATAGAALAFATTGAPPALAASPNAPVLPIVHLVLAATAGAREAAIANAILANPQPALLAGQSEQGPGHAILLEGLPDGSGQLETLCAQYQLPLSRIAPGCLCCAGQVIMRVTVNRLLRQRPRHLYIGLATATHQDQLRAILHSSPYDGSLVLGEDVI